MVSARMILNGLSKNDFRASSCPFTHTQGDVLQQFKRERREPWQRVV